MFLLFHVWHRFSVSDEKKSLSVEDFIRAIYMYVIFKCCMPEDRNYNFSH